MNFDPVKLTKFVNYCLFSDLARNKVRKEAFELLVEAQDHRGTFQLVLSRYLSIKSYLSERNGDRNSNSELAFNVMLERIARDISVTPETDKSFAVQTQTAEEAEAEEATATEPGEISEETLTQGRKRLKTRVSEKRMEE